MPNQSNSNHRGRILIVEDQGVVATDIKRCLEDGGFDVTGIAGSMEEAIREVAASRPDLVLMDIRIKGAADGIDAANHLRRHFGLPIVYLTAHDDRDTLERAKSSEPMAYLIKPFKPAELTSTVEFALDRSRKEQQARERERSFLFAMDAIGDAVLTTDSQGRVRSINRAAEELTGWRQESALQRHATEIVRPVSDQEASLGRFCALLNPEGVTASDSSTEFRILGGGGTHRWLTIRATSIPAADGSWIRIVVMQDITAPKHSEQALRRQADLLDQSHDPIFTWEVDGAITYWNTGAQALYGYGPSEALGLAVDALLPAANLPGKEWRSALEKEGRWSGEVARRTKDGREIIVEGLLVVVQDGDGRKTVLETDRDITERKHTELEIRRLNEELRGRVGELITVNKELESFNYSISHDLRAPLRHINGYAKILLEKADMGVPAETRHYLERIRHGGLKMGRMVDELLELSRTSRKEPARQVTALKSLVDDMLLELKPDVKEREIEWRIGELPSVDCDPILTQQVFANLLANAIKFTRGRKPAVIEIDQTCFGDETVLFVRDNGVGFSMKHADKLFGVFQRLHRAEDYEGTGIGLATVQRIINNHAGRIWAESELEKGSTFYFTLGPAANPQREEATLQTLSLETSDEQRSS